MTGREAFQIWALKEENWTIWVQSVAFVMYDKGVTAGNNGNMFSIIDRNLPVIYYLTKLQKDIAIFVDCPGYTGVNEGLALAKLGWRPIPLYKGTNETPGTTALIDNHEIENSLIWAADELGKMSFAKDAPPAFLIDYNRMYKIRKKSVIFDNGWDIFTEDIPTAKLFLENGIDKVLIRGNSILRDLKKVLYPCQKKGIKILFTDGYETPKEVRLKKPRERM